MGIAEVKAILANPATTLTTFGIGCIAVVWKFKMNASTANFATICGVAALASAVPFLGAISSQPFVVRALWGLAALGILGLGSYYLLWIPKAPLGFLATRPLGWTNKLTVTGATAWPNQYSEVQLFISNPSEQDYGNLDLKIGEGTSIGAFAQVTTVNNVSMWFSDSPPTIELASLSKASRQTTSISELVLTASQLGVRVRCGTLPRKTSMVIVLACITMVENRDGNPANPDYWVCLNYPANGGVTNKAWYGYAKHSDTFFGLPPEVKNLKIEAQYETTKRNNKLTKTIDVFDQEKADKEALAQVQPKVQSVPSGGVQAGDGLKPVDATNGIMTLEPFVGLSFTNQRIEIDGKSFKQCRFENVTFFYRGVGKYEFVEATLIKPIYLATDNPAIVAYEDLGLSLLNQPSFTNVEFSTIDSKGNQKSVATIGRPLNKQFDSKFGDTNSTPNSPKQK